MDIRQLLQQQALKKKKARPDSSFAGWVDEAKGQDAYAREAQSQGLGPSFEEWVEQAKGEDAHAREMYNDDTFSTYDDDEMKRNRGTARRINVARSYGNNDRMVGSGPPGKINPMWWEFFPGLNDEHGNNIGPMSGGTSTATPRERSFLRRGDDPKKAQADLMMRILLMKLMNGGMR